jgi:hypothetical protein
VRATLQKLLDQGGRSPKLILNLQPISRICWFGRARASWTFFIEKYCTLSVGDLGSLHVVCCASAPALSSVAKIRAFSLLSTNDEFGTSLGLTSFNTCQFFDFTGRFFNCAGEFLQSMILIELGGFPERFEDDKKVNCFNFSILLSGEKLD